MDLALELSFVFATKTLLSVELSADLLPMRLDIVFEKYMRLAGILLNEPALNFQKSSWSLRQFAKAMQKKGFLELNTSLEDELFGETAGLVVKQIYHCNIDEIYPESSVFSVIGGGDVDSNTFDGNDDADDPDSAIEEFVCDFPGSRFPCGREVARSKERHLQNMLSLQDLYNREEARLKHLQQKMDKATIKIIERNFRQLNIKCNVEHIRGQHSSKGNRKDKYQTLTHADSDARGFMLRHSSKSGGAQLMLEIRRKTKCLANRIQQKAASLEDKTRTPCELARITYGSEPEPQLEVQPAARDSGADAAAAKPHFLRPDIEFEQSADMRRESRKNDTKGHAASASEGRSRKSFGATSTASEGRRSKTVGACLKLQQNQQDLLRVLGFADLRRGYKKASLELHPDKIVSRDGDLSSCKFSTMSFQAFQDSYRELLDTFYDVDAQDFNARVKMHLPKAKTKCAKSVKRK
jgi:hypothetical protein